MTATPVSNGMSTGRLHPSFPDSRPFSDSRRRQFLYGRGLLAGGGGNGYLRALGRLVGARHDDNPPHAATHFLHHNDVDNEHDVDHTASDFHDHSFDVNDHHSP